MPNRLIRSSLLMGICPLGASLVLALAVSTSSAQEKKPAEGGGSTIEFAQVEPLFQKHCYHCHGVDKAKGKLRIDKLNPDFLKGNDADHWRDVVDRLNFGDMPPAKEPALKKEDRELMTNWIEQERRRAALAKNQATHFRRLTRYEYERTMQDLLGLKLDFGAKLPEDGRSKAGFRNDGDALRMSPLQYETYLQIADEALAEAIVTGPAPVVHRLRFTVGKFQVTSLPKPEDRPGQSFDYKAKSYGIANISKTDGTLTPSAIVRFREAAVKLPERCFALRIQQAYRKGEARIKVHVARVEGDASRPPVLTVAMGSTNYHGVELKAVGEPIVIDHTDFRTYEIRFRMESVSVPNVGPLNDRNSTILAAWNSATTGNPVPRKQGKKTDPDPKEAKGGGNSAEPRLKIEWIEFENPYFETWPPATHTDILFARDGMDEAKYAREVIRRFATRAYRGPIASAELDRLMNYWTKARASTDTLEDSLRDSLSVVLTSPRFLGLPANRSGGARERLNDHELASRLSYLLWCTMPDATLLQLADQAKLHEPSVLSAQIRRMIQDPRAWCFIEQFAEQWLELDRLQRVTINKKDYPAFDEQVLMPAMRLETVHFFGEVLRGDMSIFKFLNSDFTCLNDTLAAHYGIAGVVGAKFRKVKLDDANHRGGVLTHASVLTGLSDGRDGHPIKRGMWLLKNLFDETPPPPPPNVPELNRDEPKLKNLTIPQALAVHRSNAACMGCHRKIDPWGIAFEEYDAIGNWMRDGQGAVLRKKRTSQPIDSVAELPSGVKVGGMKELQDELMRSKSDEFRRAMLRKVMAYALGRSLTLGDIDTADRLVPTLRAREDRLPALIELIAASEPFQSK
jgi:mono/diheme cytochrome c family protein